MNFYMLCSSRSYRSGFYLIGPLEAAHFRCPAFEPGLARVLESADTDIHPLCMVESFEPASFTTATEVTVVSPGELLDYGMLVQEELKQPEAVEALRAVRAAWERAGIR